MPSHYQRVAEMLKRERRRSQPPREPGFIDRHSPTVGKALKLSLLLLVVAAGICYLGDYAVLRYRIARQQNALGTVTVQMYYAIHEKNGKTEFQTLDPQPQPCVNSIFPHLGLSTCWYLSRHPEKRIDI